MPRYLNLIKLDEDVPIPDATPDIDAYYDARAGAAVNSIYGLQDTTACVRTLLGATIEAVNTLETDLDIIAYAIGENGNDILEVIKGIGEAAAGSYSLVVREITEVAP